jgi:hypothetical protein
MTLDDLSKQLTLGFSNLRADVLENGIMVEQMRDELDAVHELVADVPKMSDFRRIEESVDELRADGKVVKKVVGDHSRELTQLDSRISSLEAA